MSIEILLLALACGMTILAYMIAINAHGPTRLSLSYLMATVMLAGTVWGIVQYVNSDLDTKKMEQFKRIENEKQLAEARSLSQEAALKVNKERMVYAAKLNTIISAGTGIASTMVNIDLQDRGAELEILMAKASDMKKKTDEVKNNFEKLGADTSFSEAGALLKEALQSLSEAAYYYRSFYYSEDSEQEDLRERVLRQKARIAYDKFQKAGAAIVSGGGA